MSIEIAIINRSFWPKNPLIGEALLRVAEKVKLLGFSCAVITQSNGDLESELNEVNRGIGVEFRYCKSFADSSSGLTYRVLDMLYFSMWVIVFLIRFKPKKVYVATDPPVIVPFLVMVYCRIYKSDFVYHLQDIHPEATNATIPLNTLLLKFLIKIDAITTNSAKSVITITDQMVSEIKKRSDFSKKIDVINNPSIAIKDSHIAGKKQKGFAFCGNAGRLQRIPLLLDAITSYIENGGELKFEFAGGGIYSDRLFHLNDKYPTFSYKGPVDADEASRVISKFQWAFLPIEDAVTNYAFPSKSSTYISAGCNIFAICGRDTSVGQWVIKNRLGIVVEPRKTTIENFLFTIQRDELKFSIDENSISSLKKELEITPFVNSICSILLENNVSGSNLT